MSSPMLVVGSVAFDTLHMPSGSYPKVLGGSATYAALAGAFFSPVRLVGIVGKDFPRDAIEMMRGKGIDLEGLEIREGATFHWEGRYSDDLSSRESLCTALNVFAEFHPKIPRSFASSPYVLLGNIHPALQLEVLAQVDRPALVVADTMNFWIRGELATLKDLLRKIDLLVINEEEARELSGAYGILRVAKILLGLGPKSVVIKRGEYGAMLFTETETFSAPAFPIDEVKDPTGAGDTFAGALLGYVAEHRDASPAALRRAVIYGSAVASFCVEGVGIERLAGVERHRIDERYRAFGRLAHFEAGTK